MALKLCKESELICVKLIFIKPVYLYIWFSRFYKNHHLKTIKNSIYL